MQIDLFVFDQSPQSFHKNIVPPGSPTIHAEPASAGMDHPNKLVSGELTPLVRVDDLRCAVADCSNSKVKLLSFRAQGAMTCLTLCSGQRTRGTDAVM